ncbi:MAG: response regulator [Gammaproteobacteria bacterium]|nr:response regulator [Gammaproteobacteria bacterium]MBT5634906.1 response regulator [Gammaproteobacteria bacterium]MBT7024834.1 response regulator [Gammaproteobacteria bacterium]MBT7230451.1 response regulator [Gammaproteobacteria bacterium]
MGSNAGGEPLDSELKKAKVLIIDDLPANITQLNVLLKDEYQVFFATNGSGGLEIAQNQIPDLILLDVEMPEMDVYEVCEKLKAQPETESIPVIFVTAHTDAGEEEKGLSLGAVDYIHKPFSPLLVQLRVRTQLTLKQQRDQLEGQVREVTMMFQIAVVLIEHAISGGDDSIGSIIKRISSSVRIVNQIQSRALELHQAQEKSELKEIGASCIQELGALAEQIDSGCGMLVDTLDDTIVTFQDFDRLSQQLRQVVKSLNDAASLINDSDRINDPEEWKQMYQKIQDTFVMMDAQVLYEAILSGDSKEDALRKASEVKREAMDLFEAF